MRVGQCDAGVPAHGFTAWCCGNGTQWRGPVSLMAWPFCRGASSRFAGYFFHIGYDKNRQIGKKVAESKETIVVSSQSDCKLGRLIFCVSDYRVKIEFFLWTTRSTRYNPDVAECLFDRHI
jgi:hypothetical protein